MLSNCNIKNHLGLTRLLERSISSVVVRIKVVGIEIAITSKVAIIEIMQLSGNKTKIYYRNRNGN